MSYIQSKDQCHFKVSRLQDSTSSLCLNDHHSTLRSSISVNKSHTEMLRTNLESSEDGEFLDATVSQGVTHDCN